MVGWEDSDAEVMLMAAGGKKPKKSVAWRGKQNPTPLCA